MQLLIIVKPSVKKQAIKHVNWLKKICKIKNIEYKTIKTTGNFEYDLSKIKVSALNSQIAVAIGGDGTINLAVNGLMQSRCSLAILPCGTGNDFARGFNCTAKQWQDAVFNAPAQQIDIGLVNTRYFINIAGVGFDAHVINKLSCVQNLSAWLYSWTSFKALFKYQASTLEGVFLNKTYTYKNLITVFANHQHFGGGLKIAPKAKVDDGLLECYQMPAGNLFNNLASFIKLIFKRHHAISTLTYSQLDTAHIKTPNLIVEADGELVGVTPALVTIKKHALVFHKPIKKRLQ